MNSNNKIDRNELKFRKMKEKERMDFYEYAFESTKDFSENIIGIDFNVLRKICKINRLLLGIPFKILAKNMKDTFIEYKDQIVSGYTIIYDKKKDTYELGNLFTRPKFQGRGIGNLVMQEIIREYGHKVIKLSVNNTNEAALHLYKKYGFTEDYSVKEYFQKIPLKIDSDIDGYRFRLANKDDLRKLNRIVQELPDMNNLVKSYKKTLGKTEKKKLRLENHLPAVIEKNDEILGIGRAFWSKGAPETAQIAAVAILPEVKELYPNFVSFLTIEAEKYGLKKFSWTNNKRTRLFAEYIEPFLIEPARIGYVMSRKS